MTASPPLSTLLSHALLAFTIELDNEFERRFAETGERARVVENDRTARQLAGERAHRLKTESLARRQGVRVSLEDVFKRAQAGELAELPLIVKADVAGSLEALADEVAKLPQQQVTVTTVRDGVGGATKQRQHASVAEAGFRVRGCQVECPLEAFRGQLQLPAGRADAHGAIRGAHVGRVGVGVRVDRHRFDAELAAGTDNPHRDLAPVRDEQAPDRTRYGSHDGGRFARNAPMPSWPSFETRRAAIASMAYSMAEVRVPSATSAIRRFAAATASGAGWYG